MDRLNRNVTQKQRRAIFALVLALIYAFLLVLSAGFPVTGDDWFFASTRQLSASQAVSRGARIAAQHYETTNGRVLGNFLSALLGCSKLWRELVRCGVLLGIVIAVCSLCEIKTSVGRVCALALLIALPSQLFAESYAWAAGFFNYVPPVLLLLIDLLLFKRKDAKGRLWQLPLWFLLGAAGQLFSEHMTIVFCLLSAAVFADSCKKERRADKRLLAHLVGALLGAAVMFLAPGYHSAQSAGYRAVASGASGLLATIETNFPVISQTLLGENWFVVLPMSAICAALLLHTQPKTRKASGWSAFSLTALLLTPVFFWCDAHVLQQMAYNCHVARLTVALELVFALAYLAALSAVCALCLKDVERRMALTLLALAATLAAPFLVVSPVGPRCLYGSDVLLICVLLLLTREILSRQPKLRRLAVPALLCAAALLVSTLWVCLWNGRSERIREDYITQQMQAGETEITLPDFAYPDYVHEGSSQKLGEYHYYAHANDIMFDFVPFGAWKKAQ